MVSTKRSRVDMENTKVAIIATPQACSILIHTSTIGTWVPLDRARAIAVQYNVDELLAPIFNFRPSTESPPLAPKHITAASTKPRPVKPPGAGRGAPKNPVKRVKSALQPCYLAGHLFFGGLWPIRSTNLLFVCFYFHRTNTTHHRCAASTASTAPTRIDGRLRRR